jgi:hypothetical protein
MRSLEIIDKKNYKERRSAMVGDGGSCVVGAAKCSSDVCDADESEIDEEEALRLRPLDEEWDKVDIVPDEPQLAEFERKCLLDLTSMGMVRILSVPLEDVESDLEQAVIVGFRRGLRDRLTGRIEHFHQHAGNGFFRVAIAIEFRDDLSYHFEFLVELGHLLFHFR